MDIDRSVNFWSATVYPGMPCKFQVSEESEVFLTNVAAQQNEENLLLGRVTLNVQVNNSPKVSIISFNLCKVESASVDIVFSEDDKVVFTSAGVAIPLNICGYTIGNSYLNIDNGMLTKPMKLEGPPKE